jgi:release factor glutamine methyltransferase
MLEWATVFFREKEIPSPRLSIEWLLAHVLDVRRLDLYLQFDRPLTAGELDRLRPLVKRRAAHEPLQYITGATDFYNLTLRVQPGVLIPRPETEQLVERMLRDHPGEEDLRMLDVGTGSGCIALAAKKERPGWQVTAIDISPAALRLAGRNASGEQPGRAVCGGRFLQLAAA